MPDTPQFKEIQYAFAKHIRDPENNPSPISAEDRRMAIYRDLFFNNLLSLLSQTFPVLRKLHTRERWRHLIRQFMVKHEAQSPYFLEVPQEFVRFLQEEYELQDDDLPFLVELAHYEWVELALSVSEDVNDLVNIEQDGDLLAGIPVKSNLAWLVAYEFPVHRISSEYRPSEPPEQPTYLAVCRKANDDMDFIELNPMTARLLELIAEEKGKSGQQLLLDLADEIGYPDPDALLSHGLEALQQMQAAEVLIGVK